MKLRTSLCNPTAFKKDITRFAPVWVLYTVGLLMIMTVVMMENPEYYRSANLAETLSFMASLNLCYGFLNGQLLFGDLFNARHCNALHAMPLRRECWFVTHVVSGLLFALVPNLVFALVCMTMLGGGWTVAVWWFLATSMQYVFFFGLAVLSALCVGNRFAMLLVYGIVNFFALIVYWFYYAIYEPLLYGIFSTQEPFVLWCPILQMCDNYNLIVVHRGEFFDGYQYVYDYVVKSVTLGEGWGYLGICAALGVAFFAIALLLYRRRKLECAGDFMAVRALEPVFLVLYTLCMAAFFQMFTELFTGDEYLFLALGLIVGFFTGRMLLMRTTRVFQPKAFLWFAVLAAVFVGSMVLTWLDPMGLTRYIPEAGRIQKVKLSNYYTPSHDGAQTLTEADDIETVLRLHQLILDGQTEDTDDNPENEIHYEYVSLHYVLDDGSTVSRRYNVATSSPAGQLAKEFYTRPEFVLGTGDVGTIMQNLTYVYYDNNLTGESGQVNQMDSQTAPILRGLLEAILADCAEGNMAQQYGYHEDESQIAWVEFSYNTPYEQNRYASVMIFECCRHTVQYLQEHEIPVGIYS